jgi:hypothetical protein
MQKFLSQIPVAETWQHLIGSGVLIVAKLRQVMIDEAARLPTGGGFHETPLGPDKSPDRERKTAKWIPSAVTTSFSQNY